MYGCTWIAQSLRCSDVRIFSFVHAQQTLPLWDKMYPAGFCASHPCLRHPSSNTIECRTTSLPRDMPHRLQRRKLLPQKCLNGFSPPQVRRRNHFSSSSTFLLVEVASRKPPSPKSCVRPCLCRTSLFITCKTRP